MLGQHGHNTRLHARLPPSSLGMDAWMISKLNVDLIRKLRGSLMCLAYFFDVHSMGVCATRHKQKPGRLLWESNACTVRIYMRISYCLATNKCNDYFNHFAVMFKHKCTQPFRSLSERCSPFGAKCIIRCRT